MKMFVRMNFIAVSLLLVFFPGCGGAGFPKEVSFEDAPRVLQETFKDTEEKRIKMMVKHAVDCIKGRNLTEADRALNSIKATNKITQEQDLIVAAVIIAVGEKLQLAIEEGDVGAAQHIQLKSLGK